MSYAGNTFRQFVTAVHAVFQRCDKDLPLQLPHDEPPIAAILSKSSVLTQYLRQSINSLQSIAVPLMAEADESMNLVILNADGGFGAEFL
jgi:hypothetical protein